MFAGDPVVAVVPTLNRPVLLDRCLRSLHGHVDDVIVVENVSPVAKARNDGIALAPKNAIIFSIDDDCHYDHTLRLSDTLPFLHGSMGIIQVAHRPQGEQWRDYRELQDRTPPKVWPCIFAWMGGGFVFRKSVWEEVGGYPDEFMDDVAFCMQLYRAGFNNAHSTYSYGFHDHDHAVGGLAQAPLYSQSNLHRWGLSGQDWIARGGVKTIRPCRVDPAVTLEHHERRRQRFEHKSTT